MVDSDSSASLLVSTPNSFRYPSRLYCASSICAAESLRLAVDTLTELMMSYRQAGVNELAIRLYGQPEDSIRLLGERVLPALQ